MRHRNPCVGAREANHKMHTFDRLVVENYTLLSCILARKNGIIKREPVPGMGVIHERSDATFYRDVKENVVVMCYVVQFMDEALKDRIPIITTVG